MPLEHVVLHLAAGVRLSGGEAEMFAVPVGERV